jgi:TRAP-type C4-dicarboxylate transport system permease small subunit
MGQASTPSEEDTDMFVIARALRRAVETVMALFLTAMVALTSADVIGRRLWGRALRC